MKSRLLIALLFFAPACVGQELTPVPSLLSDGNAFVPPNCIQFPPAPEPTTTIISRTVSLPETNVIGVDSIPVRFTFWRVACPSNETVIVGSVEDLSGRTDVKPIIGFLTMSSEAGSGSAGALSYVPSEFQNTGNGFPGSLVADWWEAQNSQSPVLVVTRNSFRDFIEGPPPTPVTLSDLQDEVEIVIETFPGQLDSFLNP